MTWTAPTYRWIAAFPLAAAVVLLAGCGGTSESPAVSTRVTEISVPGAETTQTPSQTGKTTSEAGGPSGTYAASEVTGHQIAPGTTIKLTFDNGQLGVDAGCNVMGSAYTITDDKLIAENFISTMIACEEPLMGQEQWVSAFLSSGPVVSTEGETVVLTGTGTVPESMTLVPVAAGNAEPLEGTSWTLDSVTINGAVSSVPTGVTVTMTFADERVQLSAGCNTISGPVEITDDAIVVGALISTRIACPDAIAQIETLITTAVAGTIPMNMSGGHLILQAPTGNTQLEFSPATPTGSGDATTSGSSPSKITESTIPATGSETGTTAG